MTKEAWKVHIETTEGITRPSLGGSKEAWTAARQKHAQEHCPHCIARFKTKKRTAAAKSYRHAMKDLGMTRVIGSVSGSVYYE